MQVKFNRSTVEKKGLFGSKIKYQLQVIVDATPEEQKFMKRAWSCQFIALGNPFDYRKNQQFWGDSEGNGLEYACLGMVLTEELLKGETIEADSPGEIQEAEEGITLALKTIANHLKVTDTFDKGSERIVEL